MKRILVAVLLAASLSVPASALQQIVCLSSGTGQNGLAIGTNTTLTVPQKTNCAHFSLETANVRVTSDGSSASSSNGDLILAGTSWTDCGPLSSLKFTAVSGSPTLNVRYFTCQ